MTHHPGRVLITGGANGIGLEIARICGARGDTVVLADVDGEAVASAASSLRESGSQVHAIACDISSDEDVTRMHGIVVDTVGRIDSLILNAGIVVAGPLEHIPTEQWDRCLQVNVMGAVRCLNAFLPSMIEAGSGTVVVTSSSQALDPRTPFTAPYVTSKFALIGLARTLALYLPPRGLRAALFCPGLVDTAFPRRPQTFGFTAQQAAAAQPNLDGALTPSEAASILLTGLDDGEFLITTTPGIRDRIREQAADLDAFIAGQLAGDLHT